MLQIARPGRFHIFMLVLLPSSTLAISDFNVMLMQKDGTERTLEIVQETPQTIAPAPQATAVVPSKPLHEIHLRPIFTLCVFMYGGISALWVLRHYGLATMLGKHFNVFLLCLTWCSMSVGMHVLNKTLAAKLMSPGLIATAQMVIAVVLVGGTSGRQLLEANTQQLRYWMIVPLFFSAMLCSSFYTYEYISLCLLTVLRNLTPLVVLPIERLTMPAAQRPHLSTTVLLSLFVMLIGAIVYGGGIKDVSLIGVTFAMVNLVLAASDRLIQRRLLTEECKGLPSGACTIVNNFVGLLPTLGLVFFTGQASKEVLAEHASDWKDPKIMVLLLLSGVIGIGICYLGFECQRVISATSFFVLQNASKVAVVSAGMTFFGDPITPIGMLGLTLSLGGSFWYSKAQFDITAEKHKTDERNALIDNRIDSGSNEKR